MTSWTTLTRRAAVLSSRTSSWFTRCCRLLPLRRSGRLAPATWVLFPSPCCRLVTLPAALLSVSPPWEALGHRALRRLRTGTLDLAHVSGNKSQAKVRCCIFCNRKTCAPYIRVLGECHISRNPELRDAGELFSPTTAAQCVAA